MRSRAVVGEGVPWVLATGSEADRLVSDWQGTVGEAQRDPWGAYLDGEGSGAEPRLGYRGEIEFAGEMWLRNRVYQPGSRAFQQPDPLAPQPGTAWTGNPYHYAGNNPIGRADPVGLRPLTEDELNRIRNRIDQNLLENTLYGLYDGSGPVAAGLGAAALLPTPLSPFLAIGSLVLSGVAAQRSFSRGDKTGGWLDVAGAVPGVTGLRFAFTADDMVKGARAAEKSRLASWTSDFASDGLKSQADKALDVRNRLVDAERSRVVGRRVDWGSAVYGAGPQLRNPPETAV